MPTSEKAFRTVNIGSTASCKQGYFFAHSLDPIQKLAVDVLKGMQDSYALYIWELANVTCRGDVLNLLLLWVVNSAPSHRHSLVQHAATPTAGLRGD